MIKLRSNKLAELREMIVQTSHMTTGIPLPRQFWFIIDANVIRDELSLLMRREKPDAKSALQEVIDAGTVVAVAPDWLREEVAEHLSEWAEQLDIPQYRISQTWQEYQEKYICFCNILSIDATENQLDIDPDDRPYIDLYNLINAPILSRDNDITKMGAHQISPEIMLHLRDYARAEVYVVTIRLEAGAGLTVITRSTMLAGQITSTLVRSFARLPLWGQLALLISAGAVALHPGSRTMLTKGLHDGRLAWHGVVTELAPVVAELVRLYQAKRAETEANLQIVEQALPPPRRVSLEKVAFAVCLAIGQPLALREIKEKVLLSGYRSRSQRFEDYLRKVLTDSSRFAQGSDGRWSVSAPKTNQAAKAA